MVNHLLETRHPLSSSPVPLCVSLCDPSSILRTHFQVPYPANPLFATLTKIPGGMGAFFPFWFTSLRFSASLRCPYSGDVPIEAPQHLWSEDPDPVGTSFSPACYTVPPMARQRLGQHFLADLHLREEIARAIRVSPHSTVQLPREDRHCWIEIGSGHGEMTQHLVATGAPVHTIEIDPALIGGLRRLAHQSPNLPVVPAHGLQPDIAAVAFDRP